MSEVEPTSGSRARTTGPSCTVIAILVLVLIGSAGTASHVSSSAGGGLSKPTGALPVTPAFGSTTGAEKLAASHTAPALPTPGAHFPRVAGGNASWINVSGSVAPSPREYPAMAYDPALRATVLFGGLSYTVGGAADLVQSDTWSFAGGTWTNLTGGVGPAPPARAEAYLTYDAHDGLLVLAGGWGVGGSGQCPRYCDDLWTFNGTAWTQVGLPPGLDLNLTYETQVTAAYDSTDGYVVVSASIPATTVSPTFAYAGGTWTNLTALAGGAASSYAPMLRWPGLVDSPPVGGLLLSGTVVEFPASGSTEYLPLTWSFHAGAWTNLTANQTASPPGAFFPALGYDPTLHADVEYTYQFSGSAAPGFASTWLFNGTWTNVTAAPAPPDAYDAALAWDGADNGMVRFGGAVGVVAPVRVLNETWEYTTVPPVLGLTARADPSPADAGANISFSATLQVGTPPYTYAWSFGDGGSSAASSPVHAFGTAGTYTVNVSVTDAAAHVGRAATVVVVVPALGASVLPAENPGDVGVAIAFAPTLTGGTGTTSFAWNFGDGGTSLASAPTHAFGTSGVYPVQLWANDSGGGHSFVRTIETVHPALAVAISASPGAPSLGELVNFSATATGGTHPYQFAWAFGDGGVGGDLANISHVFTTNGPFTAEVTVTDGAAGRATAVDNLSVALNLTILGSWHLGATPLPVSFASVVEGGVPGYVYAWAFGDGATSSAPSASHTYTSPGSYVAQLTVVDRAGHAAAGSWLVQAVAGGGPLLASLAAAPPHFASSEATTVSAFVTGGAGGYAMDWQTAPGIACTAASLESVRCTATSPGTYSVGLSVRDASGEAATTSLELVVTASPTSVAPGGDSGSLLSGILGWAPWLVGGLAGAAIALIGTRALRPAVRPHRSRAARDPVYAPFTVPAEPAPRSPSGTAVPTTTEGSERSLEGLL